MYNVEHGIEADEVINEHIKQLSNLKVISTFRTYLLAKCCERLICSFIM